MEANALTVEIKSNHGQVCQLTKIKGGVSISIRESDGNNILLFGEEIDEFIELLKQVKGRDAND